MASIPTIMSTTSSCQPPIIKQLGSVAARKRVNSPVKLSGKVASVVAEVGSLFPRVRAYRSAKVVGRSAQECSGSSIYKLLKN